MQDFPHQVAIRIKKNPHFMFPPLKSPIQINIRYLTILNLVK